MTAVELVGVSAGYGRDLILDGLDLLVRDGELLAVLGTSGSGKTTLLRVLAGFIRPIAGYVRLGDREVAGPSAWVPPQRRRIGIVPQEGALFPHLNVAANIAFGLSKGSEHRVAQMLDLVGMAGLASRRPHELSGGQQQRVALARALAPTPEVLCLDEPFAALDTSLRERLREDVRDILRSAGSTAILVTHDQEEALSIADRVAVVRAGRIAQIDEPRRIYREPVDLELARFVGSIVQVPAIMCTTHSARTALGEIPVEGSVPIGTSGTLILRPEQIRLSPAKAGTGGHGCVLTVAYFGHSCLVQARLDEGERIDVRVPWDAHLRPGDRVTARVAGPACLFVPG